MKKTIAITVAAAAVLISSGCSRAQYETEPVVLQSAQGPVTCQLYTKERVLWDQAISHPESMTREAADQICQAEGQRMKDAG